MGMEHFSPFAFIYDEVVTIFASVVLANGRGTCVTRLAGTFRVWTNSTLTGCFCVKSSIGIPSCRFGLSLLSEIFDDQEAITIYTHGGGGGGG